MAQFQYSMHVDSVDLSAKVGKIAVGLSNLDGNEWNGAVRIVDLETGGEEGSHVCDAGVSMVRFVGGDELIAAARDDAIVALYRVGDGDSFGRGPVSTLAAHHDIVSCIAANGRRPSEFASAGWDGSIYIWDTEEGAVPSYSLVSAHAGPINGLDYDGSCDSVLVTVGQDALLRTWDTRNDPRHGCVQLFNLAQVGSTVHVDRSGGSRILVGTDSGDIMVLDGRSGSKGTGAVSSPSQSHNATGIMDTGDFDSSDSSDNDGIGLITQKAVHRLRVRRILTSADRPGVVLSCSDDTTIAVSSLAALSEITRYKTAVTSNVICSTYRLVPYLRLFVRLF
jgi:WD40 repeat protein